MIINNAPVNEAIVSNVGEIGEFRIRNSAKAFSILSSGLYANKIRAIVRELSCNAVDSHAAAGKKDVPFDVHLPNGLEPHFSIRDYGTGLSHEQVTQIYTTYFESTKTASNEFIGALGLGSKSPFAYTDNFTVTAIQNGKKGIYTAFINEAGVPSIALMMQEETDEPAGVEVKFSVNDRYDFSKFHDEARYVYTYFKLRPVVSGVNDFTFRTVEYETENIIPGVHSYKSGSPHGSRSVAVMGNISYPIDIPNSIALDDLRNLLNCGLEMHFAIGELDFQASREGLSYIPQTVDAIKKKLEAVTAQLATHIAKEADAITNLWDRSVFLAKKYNNYLWQAAIKKYVADTNLVTFDDKRYGGTKVFEMNVEDLAKKFNVSIRGFNYAKHSKAYPNRKNDTKHVNKPGGGYEYIPYWDITVDERVYFIINDTKVGAVERAKYHYRETKPENSASVFVLDPVDKTKPMKTTDFFKSIANPPTNRISNASALLKKDRAAGVAKNVTIMALGERGYGGYYRQKEMVWKDAGKADSFDANTTFYYVPLSGFTMQSTKGYSDAKNFYNDVNSLPGLFKGSIYGVRKGDIEEIKKLKNWVNLEEHINTVLNGKDVAKLLMSLAKSKLDNTEIFDYNNDIILAKIDANSPYAMIVNEFKNVEKFKGNTYNVESLFRKFAPNANLSPDTFVVKYQDQLNNVISKYPLLKNLNSYRADADDIAEYINLIDAKKGI